MVEIKICGINALAAMDAALDAGADYVGLVFFPPSPRYVAVERAAPLAERARGRARVVALTVDEPDAKLDEIVKAVAPDIVQLHGRESAERVAAVRKRYGRPVMKAIPIAAAEDAALAAQYVDVADWLLFDARPPAGADRPGGHGRSFDWRVLATQDRRRPVMLSGGLNAENVASAIRVVRPDAVDVSSGVERAPGDKDPARIFAFVAAARAAAASLTVKLAKESAT